MLLLKKACLIKIMKQFNSFLKSITKMPCLTRYEMFYFFPSPFVLLLLNSVLAHIIVLFFIYSYSILMKC